MKSEYDYIFSDLNNPTRVIVWDLGRRCNFDCSYCTAWMHSTTAPFNTFEKLRGTADFIEEYVALYSMYERTPFRNLISFTGGEPAVNPAFYDLVPYLRERLPAYYLNLTTNGTWSKRRRDFLMGNLDSITVSYHAAGKEKLRKLCMENIEWMHREGCNIRVNVMMHVDWWDQCVEVCETLHALGVKYTPRTIGDDGRKDTEWRIDDDGKMRRTSHPYTAKQLLWIKNHWYHIEKKLFAFVNLPAPTEAPEGIAAEMGRMCCGGRCMTAKKDGVEKDAMFIEQTNFKGYGCMVNWFFLHIEEDRDAVYHHQTCRAKFTDAPQETFDDLLYSKGLITDTNGPICSISNYRPYLEWLESKFAEGPPTMVCPNQHCGCGVCVAKAKKPADLHTLMNKYIYANQD
ncbi:MAG: radical SAM protein [Desulfobulbia bacterium]